MLERSELDALLNEMLCPPEMELIDYVLGDLDKSRSQIIEKHLVICSICETFVGKMRSASERFDEEKDRLFTVFEEKARTRGVLPWYGFHIPDFLLLAYLDGAIPDDSKGTRLSKEIQAHLERCETCKVKAKEYQNISIVIQIANLQRTGLQSRALQALAIGLQTAVRARSRRMPARFRGSLRTGERQIVAVVMDSNANLALDDNSEARIVVFDVVKAWLDESGRLEIDVKTPDKNYWRGEGKEDYELEIVLEYENTRLVFSKEPIDEWGQVTIVEELETTVAVPEIPLKTIHLRVIPQQRQT